MQPSVTDLLSTLSATPNWKYQLGLAQLGPEEQQTAANYQLGQTQAANQLQEFNAQQALQQAQQQFAQQLAEQQFGQSQQAQTFGQQQTAAQNQVSNQSGNLQNWLTQLLGPTQGGASGSVLGNYGGGTTPSGTAAKGGFNSSYPVIPDLSMVPGQQVNPYIAARNPGYLSYEMMQNPF